MSVTPFSSAERQQRQNPALLVSVRNAGEAARAVAGGAEVIDLKEPRRGSLGRPDSSAVDAVARFMQENELPFTVALGELRDQPTYAMPIPERVSFCKMGLAGGALLADWRSDWQAARQRYETAVGRALNWVAVAYADHETAASPPVAEVIHAAAATGCQGVLVDTFDKHSRNLVEIFAVDEITQMAESAHRIGLFFAAAGRLTIDDLPTLRRCDVDIVGVRSAACVAEEREGHLTRERVTLCRQALKSTQRVVQPPVA